MTDSEGALASLARRSPTLFLIAGVLTAVTAGLSAIEHYGNTTPPVTGLQIAPFAFMLLFVGVLGLYPRLTERTPRLARVSAGFAVLGAVLAPLAGVASLADLAGLLTGEIPAWILGTHLLGRHAGQVGLVLFSAGVLRTGAYSRRVGLLLLGPATVMLLALVHIVTGAPDWMTPPLIAANALAMLALGYAFRMERAPAERETTLADSTA